MAIAKTARVVSTQTLFENSRLVTLSVPEGAPLGFVGGQYIIVDSGEILSNGKAAKRAYSIMSADSEQHTITLAVLNLEGPGSRYMHNVGEGDTVTFSGPWGKLRPNDAAPAPTLVCATDTGITAALGLVRGQGFAALRPYTTFVWMKRDEDYLLPESLVRDFLPPGMRAVHIQSCANASDLERVAAVLQVTTPQTTPASPTQRTNSWENAYMAGDGIINLQLRAALNEAGTADGRILHESFFNAPKRV